MVATTDRYASEVGAAVLRSGGNVVDAAVAVALALAVVNPEAGNVGGGGFLVVRTAGGELGALDFRSRAPASASRDMFLDTRGSPTEASVLGHRAAAVPGSVQGLWQAHRRFGTLPWQALVEPAVGLARGFVVHERFVRSLAERIVRDLARFPSTAEVLLPGGRTPRPGETLRQPELAGTLERIRDEGPDGFYRGVTADRIVAEMRRGGGLISHDDLAAYAAVWRRPLRVSYRGHTLVTMPPPSSGGVTLAQTANILAAFPLGAMRWHGAERLHLLAEAWRRAFADRNHFLGDPDSAPLPVESLTSRDYGEVRAAEISLNAATSSRDVVPGAGRIREGEHTTHFSIVGPAGDAVAVTTTLNTWYGSKLIARGTGVLLNNEMDDFTMAPGVPNHFGLLQGEANAIGPGKRMLSAMTPTIVLGPRRDPVAGEGHAAGPESDEQDLFMVLGTSGGPRIITAIFQVISNVLDHGMDMATAVAAPRIHHQHLPDEISYEPDGLAAATAEGLRALGHRVVDQVEPTGDVHAVLVGEHGVRTGASDPRRGGVPVGF
jgi:gamma-glutamyltranspeptidase/glutathione hydrolase